MPARGSVPLTMANHRGRAEGREGSTPVQDAQESNGCWTQGVALGWHPTALSVPEDLDFVKTDW